MVIATFITADISNTVECYNYLASIPNNAFTVPGDNVVFCTAGDAAIGGSNLHQTAGAASSPYGNGKVGGMDATCGNAYLVFGVYNVDWV
uniref:Uncharacterized protein n=1 Tax=Psilocybe cubensis TaxID=181762 RepID=A0A8H7Y6J1_PSICU